MKIGPVGAELFNADGQTHIQTDGQTNMMNLTVGSRNFSDAHLKDRHKTR